MFSKLLAIVVLLNVLAAVAADAAELPAHTTVGKAQPQRVRDYPEQTLARIVPGRTTKAEVEAMLGKPWRDTQLDDEDVMPGDPSVDVWEYRGRGRQGDYRVNIQFDKADVTTLIAKIPEKTGRAIARVAAPAADPKNP